MKVKLKEYEIALRQSDMQTNIFLLMLIFIGAYFTFQNFPNFEY